MNTAIAQIAGSLRLGGNTWVGLVAVAIMIGFLAALALPVYVH